MHDDAYIGGRSENNIKCVVHEDLGWKKQTTLYILPRVTGFTSDFLSFIVVESIRFFQGALQLIDPHPQTGAWMCSGNSQLSVTVFMFTFRRKSG